MTEEGASPRSAGSEEDLRLVERCKRGDREAFDALMRRHERKVYNFAYRLSGNYDEANDIAAEAFVRVYTRIQSFRGESAFLTWLFRIVTNVFLDARKRRRSRPAESLEQLIEADDRGLARHAEEASVNPQVELERSERDAMLQKAIATLPEYQRAMILLYHVEGMSYEQIAATMDLPIGTVKSRLNRARLALKQALAGSAEHFSR
ncbi:MAG: sigma-70 family RNA polymerase sigma factor [Chthonomonadales bacterium]